MAVVEVALQKLKVWRSKKKLKVELNADYREVEKQINSHS